MNFNSSNQENGTKIATANNAINGDVKNTKFLPAGGFEVNAFYMWSNFNWLKMPAKETYYVGSLEKGKKIDNVIFKGNKFEIVNIYKDNNVVWFEGSKMKQAKTTKPRGLNGHKEVEILCDYYRSSWDMEDQEDKVALFEDLRPIIKYLNIDTIENKNPKLNTMQKVSNGLSDRNNFNFERKEAKDLIRKEDASLSNLSWGMKNQLNQLKYGYEFMKSLWSNGVSGSAIDEDRSQENSNSSKKEKENRIQAFKKSKNSLLSAMYARSEIKQDFKAKIQFDISSTRRMLNENEYELKAETKINSMKLVSLFDEDEGNRNLIKGLAKSNLATHCKDGEEIVFYSNPTKEEQNEIESFYQAIDGTLLEDYFQFNGTELSIPSFTLKGEYLYLDINVANEMQHTVKAYSASTEKEEQDEYMTHQSGEEKFTEQVKMTSMDEIISPEDMMEVLNNARKHGIIKHCLND